MGEENSNLIRQTNAAIEAIKQVAEDLAVALDNAVQKTIDEILKNKGIIVALKKEIKEYEERLNTYDSRVENYKSRWRELKKKEERIEATEQLLEDEKKLITGKKQHLIEWEDELQVKERKLTKR